MSVDQLYANGRVSVMSTRLLTEDKYVRLAECNTLAEGIKILAEYGYSGDDVDSMLNAEMDSALSVLKELCANKHALSYFLARYDYLNAKVLMKCKYMRQDGVKYCFNEATIKPEVMQQAFVSDDYKAFSKNMAEACDRIDTEFAEGNRNPAIVDLHLDKAMYADMKIYAKRCSLKYKFVGQMFVYEADTVNLMSAYRVKKARLGKAAYENMIVDGGKIDKKALSALFDDEQKADIPAEYKDFYALCKSDNADLIAAEKTRKEHILCILKSSVDLLTIQPVLEYFFNKVNEIDRVRRLAADLKRKSN